MQWNDLPSPLQTRINKFVAGRKAVPPSPHCSEWSIKGCLTAVCQRESLWLRCYISGPGWKRGFAWISLAARNWYAWFKCGRTVWKLGHREGYTVLQREKKLLLLWIVVGYYLQFSEMAFYINFATHITLSVYSRCCFSMSAWENSFMPSSSSCPFWSND